jgi:hypothetical protein
MYAVRTEYRNHYKSAYFRLKLQTFRITYKYVPSGTLSYYDIIVLLQYHSFDFDIMIDIMAMIS